MEGRRGDCLMAENRERGTGNREQGTGSRVGGRGSQSGNARVAYLECYALSIDRCDGFDSCPVFPSYGTTNCEFSCTGGCGDPSESVACVAAVVGCGLCAGAGGAQVCSARSRGGVVPLVPRDGRDHLSRSHC